MSVDVLMSRQIFRVIRAIMTVPAIKYDTIVSLNIIHGIGNTCSVYYTSNRLSGPAHV
jgi:hypothetical protein